MAWNGHEVAVAAAASRWLWVSRPKFPRAGPGGGGYREDILDGIEQAPGSIAELYRGKNLGKRLIRIAPEIPA